MLLLLHVDVAIIACHQQYHIKIHIPTKTALQQCNMRCPPLLWDNTPLLWDNTLVG